MKTPRGYMQGYNAQAVTNMRQIVIAAEINVDSPDFGHLEPMVSAAEQELQAAGVTQTPEVVCSRIPATGTKRRWRASSAAAFRC